MVTASENGLSAEAVYQAARQLPREGRIVLIEMLAGSLREDESLDAEVLAEAERRWVTIESGTARSSSLAELDLNFARNTNGHECRISPRGNGRGTRGHRILRSGAKWTRPRFVERNSSNAATDRTQSRRPRVRPAEVARTSVSRFPYSVIYGIHGDALWVVAVAHHSRREGYWRGRV